MKRDAGVVLINALVVVLALSAIAAVLLVRAENARLRAGQSQGAAQLQLYLDATELLLPRLLAETVGAGVVHSDQPWAGGPFAWPVDRGAASLQLHDLQGRLNVNWLMDEDDSFAQESFQLLFAEIGLSPALLQAIVDYLRPGGPRAAAEYLSRRPSVLPRGGPVAMLDELREVAGMTPGDFRILELHAAALPVSERLNLNTASGPVLRAVLHPFPPELQREILAAREPIAGMSDIRARASEILETEDLDHLHLDRMTTSSRWFGATMLAELEGAVQRRAGVVVVSPLQDPPVRLLYRWALHD